MSEKADIQRSKRQHVAIPGGVLDRKIKILSVILPMCVGVLAAVLALAPFTLSGELSFVLDKESVDVARERMRATEALYRGEDSRGRPFSLKAGSAVQKSSQDPVVELKDMSARILLDDGPAQLRASTGQYDMDRELVQITGPVQAETAGGYRLTTNNVTVNLVERTLVSDDSVEGRTNIGTFRANKLRADLDKRTVTLLGNAQLRIRPNGLKINR